MPCETLPVRPIRFEILIPQNVVVIVVAVELHPAAAGECKFGISSMKIIAMRRSWPVLLVMWRRPWLVKLRRDYFLKIMMGVGFFYEKNYSILSNHQFSIDMSEGIYSSDRLEMNEGINWVQSSNFFPGCDIKKAQIWKKPRKWKISKNLKKLKKVTFKS